MFSQWMKPLPRLVLPQQESEFLPGAWFPSALYPTRKMGPPSGLCHIQFLKPGECACGPAGRSLRAGAGAPGRGTEWGLVQKRGRPRNGCSGAGFWAERAPQPRRATPGPEAGSVQGSGRVSQARVS